MIDDSKGDLNEILKRLADNESTETMDDLSQAESFVKRSVLCQRIVKSQYLIEKRESALCFVALEKVPVEDDTQSQRKQVARER